jgi:hypothetical protein
MCFFDVASCSSPLWCSKRWRRFLDLFCFLGLLPQGIVSGFCWREALQECLRSIFLLLRSCLSSCVAVLSNLLLLGVSNQCPSPQSLLSSQFLLNYYRAVICHECVCIFRHCGPTCLFYCIVEELGCCQCRLWFQGKCLKVISHCWGVWNHLCFVCLLLKLGCFSWFSACSVSVIKTSEFISIILSSSCPQGVMSLDPQ